MRITLPTALAAAALLLAGCTAAPETAPDTAPEPAPAPAEACPYLVAQWLAEANGQRVTRVGVDDKFDTPACQFWSYGEQPQLTVLVRHMPTPEEAMAVVDWAAPVATTNPASQPAGWNGGRGGAEGAVYSVAKRPVAVSVWSDQQESVKAQVVAEQVIATLGL
ncbi:DUF2020 domain-containing protein [Corynebacterium senegalense]|uniref:DUF2020 domain-containing protein n=1 Tax=Corynebacterium senegalense TaxID=2080750 RepID=UPI000E1FD151|nr:DUF2020 domain-containing protein [Corynebacterium senegalense]